MGIETIAAAAAIASAVVGTGTAIYSADQQRKSAHRAEDQAEADSEAAQGQAMVEARKIRAAGVKSQSTAVAALASSGVDVTQGTAEQIQTDIGQRSEDDALTTILSGKNRGRYLNRQADEFGYQAGQATDAGYINAGSSLLSSVAASGRGWRGGKTSTPAWDLSNTTRGSGD